MGANTHSAGWTVAPRQDSADFYRSYTLRPLECKDFRPTRYSAYSLDFLRDNGYNEDKNDLGLGRVGGNGMKISTKMIREGYDGKKCLVHARMCVTPEGKIISTAQDLNVFGSDLFDGIKLSLDFGEFVPQEGLFPTLGENGRTTVGCDGTPFYHKKSGKVLLVGHIAEYEPGKLVPAKDYWPATFYSVFDGEKFTTSRVIETPDWLHCGNGCGQCWEEADGSILIPGYLKTETGRYAAAVMRCAFDGETLTFVELGNIMRLEVERGFCEPSIIKHDGVYHLTLRNDLNGYHTTSRDGLHFEEPELWRFDDGEVLPNYNTQQHWLTCGGKLYLIYTRKGLDNDHVFRHRAPLVMAEVREGRVVRDTEVVVAPNRGARLGNFGACQIIDDNDRAFIMVSEWMQPRGCEQYGSNNAIWVTEVQA